MLIHQKMMQLNKEKNIMAGKGDMPRPGSYSQEYKDNWERIFGKKKKQKETEKDSKKGKK